MKETNYQYTKIANLKGIYKNTSSGSFLAIKRIDGKKHQKTFDLLSDAKEWFRKFNGKDYDEPDPTTSSLKEVWADMQTNHFPTLAESTKSIWKRRYELLVDLEKLPMAEIHYHRLNRWIETKVKYFKSDEYENQSRGLARRCNLDNELNLLSTIFNYYKKSETFMEESKDVINPVRMKEFKKKGFVRAKPIKNRQIKPEDAFKVFEFMKPLYRNLALLQFLTASRIGEAAGLQWHRIDFETRKIVVMETCFWHPVTKVFVSLNPHPKNKEPRVIYMTPDLELILRQRLAHKIPGNDFVFHVEGKPLNYGTIQLNYREAYRKSGVKNSGTHTLRHGMAALARKVGGGLDAVIAMTGHKDIKLADHYSKLSEDFQKDVSLKIADFLNGLKHPETEKENVLSFQKAKTL